MAAYGRWSYRSMVSLPLVVEGRPIGLIDVFDTKVRDYTSMLDLIRNVGRLLAGAFEKAMLVERLESGNRDLRLLVDSGLEFGATLDVDAVLGTVAERIVAVSEADICDVYGLDGDGVEILVALATPRPRTPSAGAIVWPTSARSSKPRRPAGRWCIWTSSTIRTCSKATARTPPLGLPVDHDDPASGRRRADRVHRDLATAQKRPFARPRRHRRPGADRRPGGRQRPPLPRARRKRALDVADERVGPGAGQQPRPARHVAGHGQAPLRQRRRTRMRDHA